MNIQEIEAEKEKKKKEKDEYDRTHYAGKEISKNMIWVRFKESFSMHNGKTCIKGAEDTIQENYIADLLRADYILLIEPPAGVQQHETATAKGKKETR